MSIRVIEPEQTFEKLMKDRIDNIFRQYLKEYSKDKHLRKLYYNFIHTRYSNDNDRQRNEDLIILLNFLKTQLDIDFKDSKRAQEAHDFMKKYEKLLERRAKLDVKASNIHRKIDRIDDMKDAYYPFYSAIQSLLITFQLTEKEKKREKERGAVRANQQLSLASNFDEVLQVIPFTLFGVSRKEMDPKHLKLFESYMRNVRDEYKEKDYDDVSPFSSDWFRANYPKFQKYMVQNLSFTENEATKFFKKFNALKDKLLYTDTPFTGTDRIKFFSYLPTYSALIELEERKYLPANKALPETTINRKEFIKVSRSSSALTKFALDKVFGGVFNNDEVFVKLFKDYIDKYIFDWDRFWDQYRYRNNVEYDEKGGMDKEYVDLVKDIKTTYEPWSKKQRKDLANYVNNLERKLDVFTKEGEYAEPIINNKFRLLSLTLMIYAPFADAFLNYT